MTPADTVTGSAFDAVLSSDILLAWLVYLAAAGVAYLLLLWPLRGISARWLQLPLRAAAAGLLFTPALVTVESLDLLVPAWFVSAYAVLQKHFDTVQTGLVWLAVGIAVALVIAGLQLLLDRRSAAATA